MTPPKDSAILFSDDFSAGLAVGDRWNYVEAPGLIFDDGVATTTGAGVSVTPSARNPKTGEPMFTKDATGFPGHLKWLVTSAETFSAAEGPLRVTFRAGAQCFGTDAHPYGAAVTDAATDFRLGAATFNVLDFETGLVLDFWLTSTQIIPYYERIRPPGLPHEYEAFGSISARIARDPNDIHDLTIVVDAAAGTARWEVDGTVVATVDQQLGKSASEWTTVLHHGGTPESVTPRQFHVGMGLMTLLDATVTPSGTGLVSVGVPTTVPTAFAATGPTLFGQGVRLDIEHIVVDRIHAEQFAVEQV